MVWHVEYSAKAKRQLEELNENQRKIIIAWIQKNLVGCSDPFALGKALSDIQLGWRRYRIGTYRLFVEIIDDRLLILVVQAGHRTY